MKFLTIATVAAALTLTPMTAIAQDADPVTDLEGMTVERVIGALENPPAISSIEQIDGEVRILRLSDLQAGVSSATIEDVLILIDQNEGNLEELRAAVEANDTLSAVLEGEELTAAHVIAVAEKEQGGYIVYVDDREPE